MTDQNTDALRCAETMERESRHGAAAHIRRLVAENEDLRCKLDDAEENVFGLGLVAQGHIELLEKHNADLAAMRQALEALEHTVAWNDDEVSPAFVVDCRAAISTLKARLGDD